jgi:hypothetical protein
MIISADNKDLLAPTRDQLRLWLEQLSNGACRDLRAATQRSSNSGGISGESWLFAGESGKSRKDGICSSTEFSANRNCSDNLLIAKSPQLSHFDCEKLLFANRDMRPLSKRAMLRPR